MANEIKAKELIQGVDKLAKEIADLAKSIAELRGEFTKTQKVVDKQSKSQSDLSKKTKVLSDTDKELEKIRKRSLKITRQVIKAQELEKKRVKELREEVQKEIGVTKQKTSFQQKLTKAFSASLLKITAVIAAFKGVIAVGKAYINNVKEVNKQIGQTAASFGLTRENATILTKDIRALSAAFDKDFNDVLKSANILSKEFGITGQRALRLIETGFKKGADINGEFLELLKEYPAQLRTVGLSAKQSIALITQTERAGVFSDKGIDAIKEAGIRLRELTPATLAALDAIGLSGEEIQRQLTSGEKTLFQVTQEVSGKLAELPPQSREVGTAIADIFGGPGEDVGIRFLGTLKDINLELGDIESTLSPVEESSAQLKEQWQGLTDEVAKGEGAASRFLSFFQKTIAVQLRNAKLVFASQEERTRLIDEIKNGVKEEAEEEEIAAVIQAKAEEAKRAQIELTRIKRKQALDALKLAEEASAASIENIMNNLDASIEEDINSTIEAAENLSLAIEDDYTATAENLRSISKAFKEGVEEDQQELRDNIATGLEFIGNVSQELFDLRNSFRESEIEGIEHQRDAEIAAAEKAGKDTTKIEAKYAKKEAQLRTEQAKAEKRQAIFSIVIATAVAAVKALPVLPLVALVVALGAIQAAVVAAKPIPKFKHGTDGKLQADTTAIVGDGGKPELIATPQGSFISPATDTMVHLPRGSQVFGGDSPETQAALNGGMTPEQYQGLINEQRLTRKAILNQPKESLNITGKGWFYSAKKTNERIKFIDKYFRGQ